MKKLLILLTAFSLFTTACKDKKTTKEDDRSTTRDKDDYRSNDNNNNSRNDDNNRNNNDRDNTDSRNNSYNNDDRTSNSNDNSSSSAGWSSTDVNQFVSSCTNTAVAGGMDRSKASSYCNCMQQKLEKMYPNSADVSSVDMESNSMKKMVQDCLY